MADSLEAQLEKFAQESIFLQKYCILKKKCDLLQQCNEKLVNRIQHVKKLTKRYKKERRFLSTKLDEHGDNYRDVSVPVMWEEDQLYPAKGPALITTETEPIQDTAVSENDHQLSKMGATSLYSHLLGLATSDGALPAVLARVRKMKAEKMEENSNNSAKKTPNMFMLCQHQRADISDEYFEKHKEEIPHHELTKRLALQWTSLTSEERQVYYNLYKKERTKDQDFTPPTQDEQDNDLDVEQQQSEEAAIAAANLLADSVPSAPIRNIKQEVDA